MDNTIILIFVAIIFVFACIGVAASFSLVGIIKREHRKFNNKNQK